MRGYIDKKDASAVQKIALRVRGIAEPIKAGLSKTDEQHAQMERAYREANSFDSSDGRWRDVASQGRTATNAIRVAPTKSATSGPIARRRVPPPAASATA